MIIAKSRPDVKGAAREAREAASRIHAAMTDASRRSAPSGAINLGAMYRVGDEGTVADMSQAFTLLEMAAKARTAEAKGDGW
jgi:TPR repeat protein